MIIARYEEKYLVPARYIRQLLLDIHPFVYSDPNYPDRSKYMVESIYLDTPNFSFHKNRIARQPNGFRIRLRSYSLESNSSNIMRFQLDIKSKHLKSHKESAPISQKLYNQLITSNFNFPYIGSDEDIKVYERIRSLGVLPIFKVNYSRNAFFSKNNSSIRVTLDSNIFCSYPKGLIQHQMLDKYYHLLEIKCSGYEKYPFWLAALINKFSLNKISFSKHNLALNILYKSKYGVSDAFR